MAKTFLNLTDQISTWRTKHNDIVNNIGDLAQLTTRRTHSFCSILPVAAAAAAENPAGSPAGNRLAGSLPYQIDYRTPPPAVLLPVAVSCIFPALRHQTSRG